MSHPSPSEGPPADRGTGAHHPPSRKQVDDLSTLRALAHPLRMRLLGLLRTTGPATASALGREVGESSGSTSYHLRQLARYGFVEEARHQPSRRERVWQAVHELTAWDVERFLDDRSGRDAVTVLERERLRTQARALQAWYAARAEWPRPWVRAAQDSDAALWLTADELADLSRDLWEVVERRLRGRRPDREREGARQVAVYVQAFPAPLPPGPRESVPVDTARPGPTA
ncbi:MAG TPA: helix-turn-helix domain-containing protein [Jiangellales bacterium]|nr:helix-turn-helix domain-containing protein [Jiangellales bacterium]